MRPPTKTTQKIRSLLSPSMKGAMPDLERNAPTSFDEAMRMRDFYDPSLFTEEDLARLALFAKDNERRAPFYATGNLIGGSDYVGAATGYVPRYRAEDPDALRKEQSEIPRDMRLPESYMRRVDSAATVDRVALRKRKK